MKILITGPRDGWSSESSYARLFKEKGCDVFVWEDKAPLALFGNRDWWRLSRAERIAYDAIASVRFYRACRSFKPDVLFMPKSENIHYYAVKRALEETRARLVVWYPDHPFKADQTSMNILRNLRRCDIFYIWGKFLVDAIRAAGCRRVEYLPFGFDPMIQPPDTELTTNEEKEYSGEICFVGTWDKEREATLEPLADFDLAIWGPYWREQVPSSSRLAKCIRGTGGLYGREMVKAFKGSRIVFNHLREHNGPAHNVRTMEVTGVGGGPMLVRRTIEQSRELFVEGEHLACFESVGEMTAAARHLLDNQPAGKLMAERARQRVLAEHLLSFRIDRILRDLS